MHDPMVYWIASWPFTLLQHKKMILISSKNTYEHVTTCIIIVRELESGLIARHDFGITRMIEFVYLTNRMVNKILSNQLSVYKLWPKVTPITEQVIQWGLIHRLTGV